MKYDLKWLRKHFNLVMLDLVEKELREMQGGSMTADYYLLIEEILGE